MVTAAGEQWGVLCWGRGAEGAEAEPLQFVERSCLIAVAYQTLFQNSRSITLVFLDVLQAQTPSKMLMSKVAKLCCK